MHWLERRLVGSAQSPARRPVIEPLVIEPWPGVRPHPFSITSFFPNHFLPFSCTPVHPTPAFSSSFFQIFGWENISKLKDKGINLKHLAGGGLLYYIIPHRCYIMLKNFKKKMTPVILRKFSRKKKMKKTALSP